MEKPREHTLCLSSEFPFVTARTKPISRSSRLLAFAVLVGVGLVALFTEPMPAWVSLLAGIMAGYELHHWTIFETLYGDGGDA